MEGINTYYKAKNKIKKPKESLPKPDYKSNYFPKDDKPWCKCFPGCFFVNYDAEVFDSDIAENAPSKSKQWGNYSVGQ